MRAAALLLVVATAASASSPETSVSAALADLQRLPAERRTQARYLSGYHLSKEDVARWDKVLAFWANSLSREVELIRPVQVAPGLWRVFLDDYGWKAATWEKLLDVEPYYHVRALLVDDWREEEKVVYHGGGDYRYPDDSGRVNRGVPAGQYKVVLRFKVQKLKEQAAGAPWLKADEIAGLIALTQSQVPIVRADWWLHQVAVAKGRKAGYYDWLGVEKRGDFQQLVGADYKLAQKLRKEVGAIVGRSGVTLQNRRILHVPTITGGYWVSEDFRESKDRQNVLRLIDGEAKPDASEQYGALPNGLWAFWLEDGAGARQDAAPDDIASDGQSRSNDRRVHVGLSCVRCHIEGGLRPVNDWARRIYTPPLSLDSPDAETRKRLRSLYLSDLDRALKRGRDGYAETLKGLTGLSAEATAKALADAWDAYEIADRDLDATARELGLPVEKWREKLRAAARAEKRLDPVLAALVQGLPVRVEHWEEIFPQAMAIARAAP